MDTLELGEIYAYTAIDTYTREAQVILRPGLSGRDGRKALEQIMGHFRTCQVLQTDGGSEFWGEFEEGIKRYTLRHRMARPYRKNESRLVGMESFNRTLRKECVGWVKYRRRELEEVQREVERYLHYYRYQRPHLGLNMQTPVPLELSHLT